MPLQVNVGAPQRILGMATGRVGVGWSFRGPVPETREENPTRTRTLLRVKMFIQPQTRRGTRMMGNPKPEHVTDATNM